MQVFSYTSCLLGHECPYDTVERIFFASGEGTKVCGLGHRVFDLRSSLSGLGPSAQSWEFIVCWLAGEQECKPKQAQTLNHILGSDHWPLRPGSPHALGGFRFWIRSHRALVTRPFAGSSIDQG